MQTIEKLNIFKSIFKGRQDSYGQERDGSAVCVKKHIADDVILSHLQGKYRLGVYPLSPSIMDGSGTWWAAVDIDFDDLNLPVEFCRVMFTLGIPCHVERSKSKGYHVWVLFSKPVLSGKARALMKYASDIVKKDTGHNSTMLN